MDSMSDTILAELLGMGFDQSDIETCLISLNSSGRPVTVQSATDWILQQQGHQHSATQIPSNDPGNNVQPTLKLDSSSVPRIDRPISSGACLAPANPIKSRHDYGEEKRRQRDAYDAKEREEAVKKAREQRISNYRAKELVRQQIAEDRKRKAEFSSKLVTTKTSSLPSKGVGVSATPTNKPSSSGQCRVQVRLLDGSMVRSTFSPTATLNDVCSHIKSVKPLVKAIQLVQPFPHKEFTPDEHSQTLNELGLTPSASLVVSKNSLQSNIELEPMDTSSPPISPITTPTKHNDDNSDDNDDDDDDDDDDDVTIQPYPLPSHGRGRPLPNVGFPPPGAGGGLPPPVHQPYPPINPLPHPGVGRVHHVSFVGTGHKLGGKENQFEFTDPQKRSRNISESALAAAEHRAKLLTQMSEDKGRGLSVFPSLELLSVRCLARWSSVNYLPSCSNLPPRLAHKLLMALADAKQLHPKTLNAFMKCPIQIISLDNYCYATNQLIEMLRYFPSITHLSLVSCTLLTDKALSSLLPYLSNLKQLNLNGCHQLSDLMFQSHRGGRGCAASLEVVKLSKTKTSDQGVQLLLRKPLQSLRELDLSYTDISTRSLDFIAQGTKSLSQLNIEGTKVSDLTAILTLTELNSLNVSRCPLQQGRVEVLSNCKGLVSLSIGQIPVDSSELAKLTSLNLTSFGLPERNVFFDDHLMFISGFPLSELNLTGYCNVTDIGIQYIESMRSLSRLSLSRTKLTDHGMLALQGLCNLKQLSLDNTLVTDDGMEFIRDLELLEELSVADTKVTSQFLLNGCLNKMNKLVRLNLVRTYVDDKGLMTLSIPSLMMLSIDFTCATQAITMETLRRVGCRSLEVFRNRNICQPRLGYVHDQPRPQDIGHAHSHNSSSSSSDSDE